MKCRWLAVIYFFSFLLLALGLSADAFAETKIGVVHHFTSPYVSKDSIQKERDIQNLSRFGVSWVREGVYWAEIEKKMGEYRLPEALPLDFNRYQDSSINILGLFAYGNPLYSEDKFSFISGSETSSPIFAFSNAFRFACSSFPFISQWEILNEMNLDKYFNGGSNPQKTYLEILKSVSPVAKEYDVELISGGLMMEGDFAPWLDMLTSKDAYSHYDVISLHPYCWPHTLSKAKFSGHGFQWWVEHIRAKFKSNGLAPKPIWITEIGWKFKPHPTEQERKSGIINSLEYYHRLRDLKQTAEQLNIPVVILYSLEDDSNSDCFGLQNKSQNPKLLPTLLTK
jgi:hypothetical protein